MSRSHDAHHVYEHRPTARLPGGYRPRRPAATAFYRVIADHREIGLFGRGLERRDRLVELVYRDPDLAEPDPDLATNRAARSRIGERALGLGQPAGTRLTEPELAAESAGRLGVGLRLRWRIGREGIELVHEDPSAASVAEMPEVSLSRARRNPYATRAAEAVGKLRYGRGRPRAGQEIGPTPPGRSDFPRPSGRRSKPKLALETRPFMHSSAR